jgi:hypothetical protein
MAHLLRKQSGLRVEKKIVIVKIGMGSELSGHPLWHGSRIDDFSKLNRINDGRLDFFAIGS